MRIEYQRQACHEYQVFQVLEEISLTSQVGQETLLARTSWLQESPSLQLARIMYSQTWGVRNRYLQWPVPSGARTQMVYKLQDYGERNQIFHARLDRVVFGANDPKTGAAGGMLDLLGSSAHNHTPVVVGGCLEEACSVLLTDFFRQRRGPAKLGCSDRNQTKRDDL